MSKKASIYVLDNSVILKPVFQENDWEKVVKIFFLKDSYKISIFLPEIFFYEFFNIVGRTKNQKDALEAYKVITQRQVSIIPFEEDLIRIALRINSNYPQTSFYDAAYHALAIAYDCDLITADERYYKITKKEGHIKLLNDLKI